MISKIVRFSINNRWVVILLTFLIGFAGWESFKHLPIDAVPDITNIQVQINTQVSGRGPDEIERTVTYPLETAMNGVPGVTQVRSITRYGLSQVTVVFAEGTDIYKARQLVSERLQAISGQLPSFVEPVLGPVSTGLGEIFHYVIEADDFAQGDERLKQLTEIRAIQDWYVKPRLLTVKGIAEVNTIGGYERQYHISPDPALMAKYGLHFDDIENAIASVNKNAGGGYVEQTADQFIVQASALFESLDDIKDVPVKRLANLEVVTISDIAEVGFGKELRTGAALHNGREVVLGTVLMLLGENSRDVSLRVSEQIEKIKKGLPEGYHIETLYNRSSLVNATLDTIKHNLLTGAALVIVILFLLVGNLRAALITAIVIPISLLITFILMRKYGISGNLVSLGALDFGIIVDGAVIVLDNCVRHIQERSKGLGRKLTSHEIKDTIHTATMEIRKSAGFGELIIVVVFLPVFAFVGIEGKMFIPMASTFIFALLAALALSFTFVPALGSLLLQGDVRDKEPLLMRWLERVYSPVLNYSLKARKLVFTFAIAAVICGSYFFSRLGGEFLPTLNEGSIAVQMIRPVSVGINHSVALEERSQNIIKNIPEVAHVFSRIGTAEISMDPMGPNISDSYIMLKPESKRPKEEIVADIVKQLEATTPGQRILVSQPIQLRFNELMEGTRSDVSLKVFGEDQEVLTAEAEKIAAVIQSIEGAGDVELEAKGKMTVLDIRPKYKVLKGLGLSSSEVLETVGIAIGGEQVGIFYEGMKRFPIIVRLSDYKRQSIEEIKQLPVGLTGGSTIPLEDVAEINFKDHYSSYSREETKRRIAVLINPRGRDTESFVKEAQKAVEEKIKLPPGYYMEWGGNFKNLNEAKSRLAILGPLALVFVLIMIYAAFRNVFETVLIFLCVPFALVGGVIALIVKGIPFSVSAGVGFIALSGIAVLNGVVLVNNFNNLREKGMTGVEVIKSGALLRLRPVMMTALTDILGFLPMAIASGLGAEVQRPLATVIIGGIISSTILTLIVIPVFYSSLEKWILKFNQENI
ncbi:heavy metal efflux pump, CzcA family [Bacteriovorax sp. BAL6_X]|uniref:efflux RND transporter permease subunit n=1 Tax=Bacteriovorax sp. BAL6_X TaxID=1201290 RepID=UPI0003862D40|nr:CusA/CzcA family heavy metal efflux RND transporter [Bacteriovorax sp. BAL6_X]EPZ51002.1 heavy metal efflux pump, CzcA family [Bacteriovorax sp. BAL6_X]